MYDTLNHLAFPVLFALTIVLFSTFTVAMVGDGDSGWNSHHWKFCRHITIALLLLAGAFWLLH